MGLDQQQFYAYRCSGKRVLSCWEGRFLRIGPSVSAQFSLLPRAEQFITWAQVYWNFSLPFWAPARS